MLLLPAFGLLLCGVLCALSILPMTVLLAGPFGKNLRALASNEKAARAFGIDVNHHLIAAFIWSSACSSSSTPSASFRLSS